LVIENLDKIFNNFYRFTGRFFVKIRGWEAEIQKISVTPFPIGGKKTINFRPSLMGRNFSEKELTQRGALF